MLADTFNDAHGTVPHLKFGVAKQLPFVVVGGIAIEPMHLSDANVYACKKILV
jgi:hypothetical protein